jgi:RimJ/RimL family protein N-acetyltransferase
MEVQERTVRVQRLRNGDARTVMGVFERLSERSRRARFNGSKPCLTFGELRQLASVDRSRYALVAYIDDDPQPVAIARFVRDGGSAEIAFAVADEYQRRGIGSFIAAKLIADARAAGITEIVALVATNNHAAVAVLRRVLSTIEIRHDGAELAIGAAIA